MKEKILFEFRNVSYEIDERRKFVHINWQAKAGETWAVYGAAASGKSSLCSVFQSAGHIKDGELKLQFLEGKHKDAVYHEIIEVSFTSSPIHWGGSYYQQRYTPSEIVGIPTVAEYLSINAENEDYAGELLAYFHLSNFKDSACIKLSNGQMRKLLIAEALMKKPSLLILDNPYTGLDMESRKILNDKLSLLAAGGQIMIFLINHLRDMPSCVTHVLELDRFKIKKAGPRDEVSQDGSVAASFHPPDWPELLHPAEHNYEKAVALRNVTIEYEGNRVLDNINWSVRKGENWALLGGNGSGKSTLLSLIFADNTQAYEKDIHLFDRRRGSGESIWDIKEHIGFLSPEFHLYFTKALTCTEVATSGLTDTMLAKAHLSESERKSVQSFFAYFAISHLANRYFQRVSKAEQRVVLLIRALIKNAEMLILDEPYHFFDEQLVRHANRLLDWYCRDKTLIFVTHHAEEIPASVKHIMQMDKGVGRVVSAV